MAPKYLIPELVAGEAENTEALTAILGIQFLQLGIILLG